MALEILPTAAARERLSDGMRRKISGDLFCDAITERLVVEEVQRHPPGRCSIARGPWCCEAKADAEVISWVADHLSCRLRLLADSGTQLLGDEPAIEAGC